MPVILEGLRTVIYPAPDLAAAKAWWSRLLGVDPYFDEPFYVGYSVAGYELGLLPSAPAAVSLPAATGRPTGSASPRQRHPQRRSERGLC